MGKLKAKQVEHAQPKEKETTYAASPRIRLISFLIHIL
jgi:hypothetical protein